MTLTIRFATATDAGIIVNFICALAEYERVPAAVKVTTDEIRAQMQSGDPPFECLLAEYETNPVGFALFFRNYSTWTGRCGLYLEDLFVSEEYRGRGIGGALMRRLREVADERGWARVDWAVLNWNTHAQSFYREQGGYPLEGWTSWRLDNPGRKCGKA
jgi:GNAT superfamily N-acetyltransferase